jgi:hypothetical protein
MLILFDNGTPAPLRYVLTGHVVVEAIERGWDRLVNGELIRAAEAAGFEVLLTTDKNMRYQQNLTGRKIAFVVIGNQQWPTLRRYADSSTLVTACVLLLMDICLAGPRAAGQNGVASQQQTKPLREFEVASIRPTGSDAQRAAGMPFAYSRGGRFTAISVTLVDVMVSGVYPTRRAQLRGGPNWIDTGSILSQKPTQAEVRSSRRSGDL